MESPAASRSFRFRLNGTDVTVSDVPPQTTLLDFVRSRGLTGSKEGCAEGECGACAVVMVKERAGACAYQPVNSCLIYLPMVAGEEVYTVEGLRSGDRLHPVQTAIAEAGGSQCGYCTPGFVMSLFAEHYRPGREGACNTDALGGNLCRCTGYRPIGQAAGCLQDIPADDFLDRPTRSAPSLRPFRYSAARTRYSRPGSLQECLEILKEDPQARVVAGNTDLGVASNLKYEQFPSLVSIDAVPELRIFHQTAREVEIGAGLALEEIGLRWNDAPPVVREWLPLFASPLIRNRATFGGNLCTASPIGDASPLLLALDARINIASHAGFPARRDRSVLHRIPADSTETRRSRCFHRHPEAVRNPRAVLQGGQAPPR